MNVQAQVVVGDAVAPQPFSALEVISNGTGGLRLPQLTNAQRAAVQTAIEALAPAEQPKAKGLMIFNLDTKCVNTWNGTEWISTCAGLEAPDAPDAPTLVSNGWATVNPTNGQPAENGKVKVSVPSGFTVNWYDEDGVLISAATTTEWEPRITLGLTAPGVYTYYAESVEDGTLSATRTAVTYTICGAPIKTGDGGGWLTLMCHNLGADNSKDPYTYSTDILGGLYQWGRKDLTHGERTSTAQSGITNSPANGIFYYGYGDWRQNPSSTLWGNGTQNMIMPKAANDPCPPGWKVPSQKQWAAILKTSSGDGAADWTWTNDGYNVGNALFLPTAGFRDWNDGLVKTGSSSYWSSTIYEHVAYQLFFHATSKLSDGFGGRAYGHAVRCTKE